MKETQVRPGAVASSMRPELNRLVFSRAGAFSALGLGARKGQEQKRERDEFKDLHERLPEWNRWSLIGLFLLRNQESFINLGYGVILMAFAACECDVRS